MSEETTAQMIGAVATGAMYQTLAVVSALAQKGVLDPESVANWARFFASSPVSGDAKLNDVVGKQLDTFAGVIKAMVMPAGGRG